MKLMFKSKRFWIKLILAGGVTRLIVTLALFSLPTGKVSAQQPTGSIPTVTGTPSGPVVTVYSNQLFIDVYAGPSMYDYERIGVLASGEQAPALGYSQDGNWIEIVYVGVQGGKGWIYGPNVSISPGSLPKLAAPPTPVPLTTPTLDPTYVAAYGLQLEPTHLPTFTPPAVLKLPTFAPNTSGSTKVPFGLVILVLALIGILGAVISFLRGNR
jgi:hypothetical protein